MTTEMWMTWIGAIVLVVIAYVSDRSTMMSGELSPHRSSFACILSRGRRRAVPREGPSSSANPGATIRSSRGAPPTPESSDSSHHTDTHPRPESHRSGGPPATAEVQMRATRRSKVVAAG